VVVTSTPWEGQFVRYTMSDDLTTCGGTFELGIGSPHNVDYSWQNASRRPAADGLHAQTKGNHPFVIRIEANSFNPTGIYPVSVRDTLA